MTRNQGARVGFPWLAALGVALAVGGCSALLDIDHIEFGDQGVGATGGGGAAGGTGGQGGDGGTTPPPTCDDGMQNGDEEGVDCGGTNCEECDEDCTNGIDDGGNGLVDCEDPVCAGYECVPPPPPTGWWGPAVLYVGDSPPADCAAGWPDRMSQSWEGSVTAPPASCSNCTCGAVSGASCEVAGTALHDVDPCGNVIATETPPGEAVCHGFAAAGNVSALGETVSTTGGSCAPSGGAPSVTPPTAEHAALLCGGADQGGGCSAADEICVRSPSGVPGARFCIHTGGDASCPSGPYTEKNLIYEDFSDSRDCTSCSCNAPSGVTCDGTTTLYSGAGCTTAIATLPHDGSTCVSYATEAVALMFAIDAGPSGGSCPASGGQPTGTASSSGLLTVCCLP